MSARRPARMRRAARRRSCRSWARMAEQPFIEQPAHRRGLRAAAQTAAPPVAAPPPPPTAFIAVSRASISRPSSPSSRPHSSWYRLNPSSLRIGTSFSILNRPVSAAAKSNSIGASCRSVTSFRARVQLIRRRPDVLAAASLDRPRRLHQLRQRPVLPDQLGRRLLPTPSTPGTLSTLSPISASMSITCAGPQPGLLHQPRPSNTRSLWMS